MNYEPFCSYWFYGGTTSEETAAYFSSWGLLNSAPSPSKEIGHSFLYKIGQYISLLHIPRIGHA